MLRKYSFLSRRDKVRALPFFHGEDGSPSTGNRRVDVGLESPGVPGRTSFTTVSDIYTKEVALKQYIREVMKART